MKPFLQVEQTRQQYHRDAGLNSVHRSSLLVPNMPGAVAEVSFLNHFLLKRNIPTVGCRITAVDGHGNRLESRLHLVTEPRVYTLPLNEAFSDDAQNFLVEFFAGENLFIPFCAAMANHHGPGFVNVVHSFNRILNDPFEDDAINSSIQSEAAIDTHDIGGDQTFLVFMSGAQAVTGEVRLTYERPGSARISTAVPVGLAKLGRQIINVTESLGLDAQPPGGALKVSQPAQFMFYGRLMGGRLAKDGAFSANHSYYDSSATFEYWRDSRPSRRLYPFFTGLRNRIRFYPIMSPGALRISLLLRDANGRERLRKEVGEIHSPGGATLDVDVNEVVRSAGIDPGGISAYAVVATPVEGATPTRVNHQLLCGALLPGSLEASINMSLGHPSVFQPEGKTAFIWGQAIVGHDLEAAIGFCGLDPDGAAADIDVTLYSIEGELLHHKLQLPPGAGQVMTLGPELSERLAPIVNGARQSIWYVAKSMRGDLNAFAFSRHRDTGHTTGEHNF